MERALPVDMDVTSQAQLPRLALVIVTDKSGSMQGTVPTGETKLDVVKSAALSVLELLNPFDRVGLLAFDADFEWTVPLTEAQNRDQVATDLATLQPGGGTVLYPALEEAYRELAGIEAAVKHVIVLSDGLTNPGEFERLARAMRAAKITVSTVAVGDDADAELMASIASWAGGRTYVTADPRNVPRIFMTETLLASRGLLVETRFLPLADGSAGAALRHRAVLAAAPARVRAHVPEAGCHARARCALRRAAARDLALRPGTGGRVHLGPHGPVGEGVGGVGVVPPLRGAAGALDRAAGDLRGPAPRGVDLPRKGRDRGGRVGRAGRVRERARGLGGRRGSAAGPARSGARAVRAAGRYEGTFAAEGAGDWVVTVSARSADGAVSIRTVGASVSYPEEYLDTGVNRELLEGLAAATGGGVVDPDDAGSLERLLRRERGPSSRQVTLWPLLVALALGCFFLDVVVRKFTLPEGLRERLGRLFGRAAGARSWSYEELAAMVQHARDEERRKLRDRISGMAADGKVSSDLAAYLYIARMHARKQGSAGSGGSAARQGGAAREEGRLNVAGSACFGPEGSGECSKAAGDV